MEVSVSLSTGFVSESAARWRLSKKKANTIILTVPNGKRPMGKIVLMMRKIQTFTRLIDHAKSRKNQPSVTKARAKIREYKKLVYGLKKKLGFTGFQVLSQNKVSRSAKAKSMTKSTYTVMFDAPARKKMTSLSNIPEYVSDFHRATALYVLDLEITDRKMWESVDAYISKHAGGGLLHTFSSNTLPSHAFKPHTARIFADDKTDLISLALRFGEDDYADDAIDKIQASVFWAALKKHNDDNF